MSSEATELHQAAGPQMDRRRFMQGFAAVLVGAGISGQAAADVEDYVESGVRFAADATSSPLMYAVSPASAITAESVDLLTGGALDYGGVSSLDLTTEVNYDRVREMRSADEMMLDQLFNTLENARNVAWFQSKEAWIESVQDGATASEAVTAADDALATYYVDTVQRNLLNHWNQQMNKLDDMITRLEEHEDVSNPSNYVDVNVPTYDGNGGSIGTPTIEDQQIELVDGSSVTVRRTNDQFSFDAGSVDRSGSLSVSVTEISASYNDQDVNRADFRAFTSADDRSALWVQYEPSEPTTWTDYQSWAVPEEDETAHNDHWGGSLAFANKFPILWTRIEEQYSSMVDNVKTWSSEAYSSLQADEISIEDLMSPAMLASEYSTSYEDTGHYAYAASDLAALGLSTDYEHEQLIERYDGSQLEGTLFVQADSFSADVGDEIDPANYGHVEIAFNPQTYSRALPDGEFKEGIENGIWELQTEPETHGLYQMTTTHGETVTIEASEFSDQGADSDPGPWQVDLSDQLDDSISTAVEVNQFYQESAGEGARLTLTEPFTLLEAYDAESGEEVDSIEAESYNTQTADVTRTKEELEKLRQAFEDAGYFEENSSGGGGGIPGSLSSDGAIVGALVGLAVVLGVGSILTS